MLWCCTAGWKNRKKPSLSVKHDHVIVGGDTGVSFSTLLVQSHMFMKTAMVKGRGLWTFILHISDYCNVACNRGVVYSF